MHLDINKIVSLVTDRRDESCYDDYSKMLLDKFASNVDTKIQNKLMTELMLKYSELSASFEEKNQLLKEKEENLQKYNNQLEDLVNKKVEEISNSQMATIYALVKLSESRDDDTGAHVERTSTLCKLMAQCLRKIPKYMNIIDVV